MNAIISKKTKWFWQWEDDKEESWLREMAKQGLHLVKAGYFGQYTFSSGKPLDMVYRLDFIQTNKKDENYFQLFRDAGWEHVGEMVGWQYWRKEAKQGETAEIYTDAASKNQKYQRLLGFLAILFLPVWMGVFNMRNLPLGPLSSGHWIEWVFIGIELLLLAVFILYICIFVRILNRIRKLQHQ